MTESKTTKKPRTTASKASKASEAAVDKNLEELLSELNQLTEQMESGESSLEESFQLYAKGMSLLKQSGEIIDRIEGQVQKLNEEGEKESFAYEL